MELPKLLFIIGSTYILSLLTCLLACIKNRGSLCVKDILLLMVGAIVGLVGFYILKFLFDSTIKLIT